MVNYKLLSVCDATVAAIIVLLRCKDRYNFLFHNYFTCLFFIIGLWCCAPIFFLLHLQQLTLSYR